MFAIKMHVMKPLFLARIFQKNLVVQYRSSTVLGTESSKVLQYHCTIGPGGILRESML